MALVLTMLVAGIVLAAMTLPGAASIIAGF